MDDVSFDIKPGSIIGVVGESGCGKTSLAKTVAGLVEPSGGKMEFLGVDVTEVVEKRNRRCCANCKWSSRTPTRP